MAADVMRPDAWASMGSAIAAVVPDMVCLSVDGCIAAVNAAGRGVLGAGSDAELIGQPFDRFIHPDFSAMRELGLAALAEEPEAVPVRLVGIDGRVREVHLTVRPLGPEAGPPGAGGASPLLLYGRDATGRTRAVEGLLASESRFRTLVDQAFAIICLVRDGLIVYVNAKGSALLGAGEAGALLGQPFTDMLHPDYVAIMDLGLDGLAAESGLLPMRLRRLDGGSIDVEARIARFGGPRDSTFMVEARDITERQRAALALREREQRLQGILDTVSEAIVTTDENGIIQSFNPAARDMFGYTAREVLGRNVSMLMPERHARDHDDNFRRMRTMGDRGTRTLGLVQELEGRRKDGSLVPIEIGVTRLNLAQGMMVTGIIRDITERRRREEAERRYTEDLETQVQERTREVRRLGRQTELILRSAGDGIVGFDAGGCVIFANPVAERLLRAGPNGLRGRPLSAVFREAGTGAPPPAICAIVAEAGADAHGETTLLALDGTPVAAAFAAAPITDEAQRQGAVVVFRDISARKEAEARLRLAYTVFDTASEAIVVCDTDHVVTMVNPAFTEITGHAEPDVLGRSVEPLLFDRPERFRAMVRTVLDSDGQWADEFWHQRADGVELALRLVASTVRDESGRAHTCAIVLSDITQRKRDEERIHYQAKHDTLTGLPNRAHFMEVLGGEVAAARRTGSGLALMFVDLDGFKAVNDSLGHDAGDLLLKGAGQRLVRAARERDAVFRLGGDEFTMILPGLTGPEAAASVAGRVLDVLAAPFSLSGRMARISASIGVALLPADGQDADTLLRHADRAMYHAKAQGKANVQFYRPDLDARIGPDETDRFGTDAPMDVR